ncbi:MAG: hypothetical protein J6V24_03850 [Clostridia bacterium]|nr:hypothetical protein [Clostridia bacterium]
MNNEAEKTLEDEIEFEDEEPKGDGAEDSSDDTRTVKVCPFCGQIVILKHPGQVPEAVCMCSGADNWRDSEMRYGYMQKGIYELFGEDCKEVDPSFEPVSEEAEAMLERFAHEVAFKQVISLTLTLPDGSVCGMKRGKVSRKIAFKAER